ncbi:hypothetical protein [Helicobacter rodentium]|uniref:hypothetical protein n=1 Tax=Helicobacter rodentium TaxID=59617 RepID=UPI002353F266|nr:hypothetical protein [Helicobacter rodentium]
MKWKCRGVAFATASLRSVRRSAQSASSAHTCKSIIKHTYDSTTSSLRGVSRSNLIMQFCL